MLENGERGTIEGKGGVGYWGRGGGGEGVQGGRLAVKQVKWFNGIRGRYH